MTDVQVSVVVATHNRAESLRRCLESLAHQTRPPRDYEVVVVDDGSTDGTRELLDTIDTPFVLVPHSHPNRGQAASFNVGVDRAQGAICLFVDDDMIAAPTLVEAHLDAHRHDPRVVGIGHIDASIPSSADAFTRFRAGMFAAHYEDLAGGSRRLTWRDCYSGNLSVRRDDLLAVGGFATDFRRSFDNEVGFRLEQHGLRLTYLPLAATREDFRKTYRSILRDIMNSGRDGYAFYCRHPAMLPGLELGGRGELGTRSVLLRRTLIEAHVPVGVVGALARAVPARRWRAEAFRFLSSYAWWSGVRSATGGGDTWKRLTRPATILMYHALCVPPEPASRFIVDVRAFSRQMAWLARRGYRVIGLEDLALLRSRHQLPPAKSVVVTFDDAYADNAAALQILRGHGFPATIFVVSDRVGLDNDWDREGELCGRPLLARDLLTRCEPGVVDVGAHSRTHRALTDLTADELQDELAGSRAALESMMGRPVVAFAYPFGRYDETVVAGVEEAGYTVACAVGSDVNTAATPNLALRRLAVEGGESLARFAAMLVLGRRPRRRPQTAASR